MRPGTGAAFPALLGGLAVAGLLSALLDATLGWEPLLHAMISGLMR